MKKCQVSGYLDIGLCHGAQKSNFHLQTSMGKMVLNDKTIQASCLVVHCHLCAEYCYVNSKSAIKDLLQKTLSQQYVLV